MNPVFSTVRNITRLSFVIISDLAFGFGIITVCRD